MRKTVLSIAGSDSSGGAGIQADLLVIRAAGLHAATAVTAITAQNTRGVQSVWPLEPAAIRAQIDAVLSDLDVVAIKLGMLGSAEAVVVVADALVGSGVRHIVVDPVLVSTSGTPLLPDAAVRLLIERVLPLATVVTPNAPEAARLTDLPVHGLAQAEAAGRRLLQSGVGAVVLKGGHLVSTAGYGSAASEAVDLLVQPNQPTQHFVSPRYHTPYTHGTGCIFAASLAAHLALGKALPDAVGAAKEFVSEAIRRGVAVGAGHGPADAGFGLARRACGDDDDDDDDDECVCAWSTWARRMVTSHRRMMTPAKTRNETPLEIAAAPPSTNAPTISPLPKKAYIASAISPAVRVLKKPCQSSLCRNVDTDLLSAVARALAAAGALRSVPART